MHCVAMDHSGFGRLKLKTYRFQHVLQVAFCLVYYVLLFVHYHKIIGVCYKSQASLLNSAADRSSSVIFQRLAVNPCHQVVFHKATLLSSGLITLVFH